LYISGLQAPWLMADAHEFSGTRRPTNPSSTCSNAHEKGVLSDSFSLCYGGMDIGGGAMVLGGVPAPSDMVFSHSDPLRR